MSNYFDQLTWREKVQELGTCDFFSADAFSDGCSALNGKDIVIVGCGAQGLHQGLNMRDSGLNVRYALRAQAIESKNASYQRASDNGFEISTIEEAVKNADLIYNLTPDKQHGPLVSSIMPLIKPGATLAYSHGFNVVEEGQNIREDITVVMCAPKSPGTEVREEFLDGFGVPTLIAVLPQHDPQNKGWAIAKALAVATGGHRAGVLASSFVAEVKSDLMGEQTILCGMQQAAAILAFDAMIAQGIEEGRATALIQQGLPTITHSMKLGGITLMMDRLPSSLKVEVFELADRVKSHLRPLFEAHMEAIMNGKFAQTMMADWQQNDKDLLAWRNATRETGFEQSPETSLRLNQTALFEENTFLIAMIKAGVELAYDVMVEAGIKPASAYYESLHETPLIAYTIGRQRLFEMNRVISDTAEYGNYLFCEQAIPILRDHIMPGLDMRKHEKPQPVISDEKLMHVDAAIRDHGIEAIGHTLREYMQSMRDLAKQSHQTSFGVSRASLCLTENSL